MRVFSPRLAEATPDKNLARGLRAGARAREQGASALDAAKCAVAAAFDESAAHIDFKARVAAIIARGTSHPANRARFSARAETLRGEHLDAAIAAADRWHADAGARLLCARHLRRPIRLDYEILAELRLLLRYLRRYGLARDFPALIDGICTAPLAMAAE